MTILLLSEYKLGILYNRHWCLCDAGKLSRPSEGVEMWVRQVASLGGSRGVLSPRLRGVRWSSPEKIFKNRGLNTPFPAISGSDKEESV